MNGFFLHNTIGYNNTVQYMDPVVTQEELYLAITLLLLLLAREGRESKSNKNIFNPFFPSFFFFSGGGNPT